MKREVEIPKKNSDQNPAVDFILGIGRLLLVVGASYFALVVLGELVR